jgi:hypothetical protein
VRKWHCGAFLRSGEQQRPRELLGDVDVRGVWPWLLELQVGMQEQQPEEHWTALYMLVVIPLAMAMPIGRLLICGGLSITNGLIGGYVLGLIGLIAMFIALDLRPWPRS